MSHRGRGYYLEGGCRQRLWNEHFWFFRGSSKAGNVGGQHHIRQLYRRYVVPHFGKRRRLLNKYVWCERRLMSWHISSPSCKVGSFWPSCDTSHNQQTSECHVCSPIRGEVIESARAKLSISICMEIICLYKSKGCTENMFKKNYTSVHCILRQV